ncbi:hypothetical protein [Sphingomonas profundi]|uniref:hypothetical protein n=1 Tax=Alterirhizorhabdus profundi TaxID=2681549 RepID=UPI0018D133D0|nr:hypothetical protein [Sphingomonas profundi]
MRDAQTLLLRALCPPGMPAPTLRLAHSEAWASATFAGARHRFEFDTVAPARADAFAAALGDREFALPGHLVADIAVTGRTANAAGVALTIEALTVENE